MNVTPLVFTNTGGIADECVKYHSSLAELSSNKKAESYSSTISWIKAKVSFTIVRSAILCLRGPKPRRQQLDFVYPDLEIENFFLTRDLTVSKNEFNLENSFLNRNGFS